MKEIGDLEDKVWTLIKAAADAKDSYSASLWQSIIPGVENLKNDIDKVEKNIASRNASQKLPATGKSVVWTVTKAAIRSNYLSTGEALKAGLLPEKGEFEVKTSTGRAFKTDVTSYHLRERGEIAKFYREAKIKAGDQVEWREVKANEEYFLSKK